VSVRQPHKCIEAWLACDRSHRVAANPTCAWGYKRCGIASKMADKTYLVRLKPPRRDIYWVVAASAEIQGEHLVFLDSKGKLLILVLLEIVESWIETERA
jgi:hypothetical protein